MTRPSARDLVTDWQFWGMHLLLAALVLVRVGALPEILGEISVFAIFACVMYPRAKSAWTKFVTRCRTDPN